MRLKNVAFLLVGSLAVFVACAAEVSQVSAPGRDAGSDAAPSQTARDSIAEATGFDVVPIAEAGGDSIGIDIVPVNDAKAEPTKFVIDCINPQVVGSSTYYYAELVVSSKTKEQLIGTVGMICYPTQPSVSVPSSYTCNAVLPYLKDGSVLVSCLNNAGVVTLLVP